MKRKESCKIGPRKFHGMWFYDKYGKRSFTPFNDNKDERKGASI